MNLQDGRRILYVDLAPLVGGSVISLFHLVTRLDSTPYRPHVLLNASNAFAERFRAAGVACSTIGVECTPAQEGDAGALGGLRSSGLVGALKRWPAGESLVHTAGFWLRDYRPLARRSLQIREVIDQVKPDLLHLNDVVCVSRAAIMAAKAEGVPAICHLRAMAWRNRFDRRLSRSLAGLICISRAVDSHQRTLGGKSDPSWLVYNGVDVAAFEDADGQLARRQLGLSAGDIVVGCVGRLVPWKGQHVFLRAIGEVVKDQPTLRVLVVGSPEAQSAGYARELKRLACELEIDDRVCWTGFRNDLPAVLGAMDIMVHASVEPEPFGRVIIEAMATGTPVVAANGGAVPEIVRDGETGLLVPPGDHQAMAEAVRRMIASPMDRSRLAEAARRDVRERFTAERYVQGILNVYREILS